MSSMEYIMEDQIERLREETYYYLKTTAIENYNLYEVNEDENGEKNMKQLILGYDNFEEFYTDKYLQKITNDFIDSPCFDVVNDIGVDFITADLMSYMITYIHKQQEDELGDTTRLTDYSVKNILRLYTYWYARGFGGDEVEEWFEEFYEEQNENTEPQIPKAV